MGRYARFVPAALLALALALAAMPAAAADLCVSNASCPTTPLGGGRFCVMQKIFGVAMPWGNCAAPGSCNTASNCIAQAECRDGVCQRPAGTCVAQSDCGDTEQCVAQRCEQASPGKGSGIPGEGRHCIPPDGSKPNAWVQDKNGKPVGACPQHTRCNEHGFCVRIEI